MLPWLRQKSSNVIVEAATRVEFPNLLILNTTAHATPAQGEARTSSITNIKQEREIVPGSSKSAAVAKVAAKKAAPKNAAGKKRAREDEDENKEDGHTLPIKKLRVTKAPNSLQASLGLEI